MASMQDLINTVAGLKSATTQANTAAAALAARAEDAVPDSVVADLEQVKRDLGAITSTLNNIHSG